MWPVPLAVTYTPSVPTARAFIPDESGVSILTKYINIINYIKIIIIKKTNV